MNDVRDNDVRDNVGKVGKSNHLDHTERYKQAPDMIRFVFFFNLLFF